MKPWEVPRKLELSLLDGFSDVLHSATSMSRRVCCMDYGESSDRSFRNGSTALILWKSISFPP